MSRADRRRAVESRLAIAEGVDFLKAMRAPKATYQFWRAPDTFHEAPMPTTARIIRFPHIPDDNNDSANQTCYGNRETAIVRPYRPTESRLTTVEYDDEELLVPQIWTHGDVRAWLRDAMVTLQRLPIGSDITGMNRTTANIETVRDAIEAYGYNEIRTKQKPTAADIKRLDYCLPWMLWLDEPKVRMAVCGVAMMLNLRSIAEVIRARTNETCSHVWARELEKRGVAQIAAELNITKIYPGQAKQSALIA